MIKSVLIFLAIVFPFFASAGDEHFKLNYHGFNFYLPESPTSAGFLGSQSDTIVLKYGDAPGQGLVGFSVENEMATGGCTPEAFFNDILGKSRKDCDRLAVESFQHVFVRDRESGIWPGDDYKFYYFIGETKTTVFFVTKESPGKILKVDTDFLTENALKKALKDYLN